MVNVLKSWLAPQKTSPFDDVKPVLDSVGKDYIIWASQNAEDIFHSDGLPDILDHPTIQSFIKNDKTTFQDSLNIDQKIFSISSGSMCYQNIDYTVLWVEDSTKSHENTKIQQQSQDDLAHLQSILDSVQQPVWVRDTDGQLTWCNKSYGDFFHKTTTDIIANQKEFLIKPTDQKEKKSSQKIAEIALKKETVQSLDGYAVIDGARYYLNITETPRPNMNVTIGTVEDWTWKEQMRVQNDRNMSAYQTLFSSLQTAVALYDSDHKLEFYNAGFSRLWQLEESWLNQKPTLGDILEKLRETRRLPEQADFRAYKKEWTDMFTKLIETHEDIMVLPDGTVLRTQVLPHPMGGVGHIFEDVTSKLELESSYNTLMAVQKETIDNLAEGIVVYGSDGRLKLWNQTFQKLWKFNPEDLEGEPHLTKILERVKDFFDEDNADSRKKNILTIFEKRQDVNELVTRQDGMVLDFSSVFLPDGGMLLTYADVTDTIRVEGALREKNMALETAEQLKTDFLAKISYQLRTPLSAIMGFNDILDREYFGELNDKQKEYTSGMKEAGQNLKNLIDDILDLTSIEAGIICLETEEVQIDHLLRSVQENIQDWADEKQIKIDLQCPKNLDTLTIDRKRIRHALSHIMRNAISFTPEKGRVRLSATQDNEIKNIVLSVQDEGDGISQRDLDLLFKPFEKGDINGGTGLGLTLVKNIVELHNGSIDVNSKKDQGTTISLTFPLVH